ncbi:hypothetical protein CC1G_11087 [Coprinopsis cinerea okayama7|uniref:MIT domain-containing protein n=1 Tax=Coprinopsis cinerea (strain Okayama-7 / 130 / ATCC MYA-4618 / FGSC 9003) TaxID=240176 RepID=A8P7L8_COPC7|nr:hypothetical protein CC1G_11087 [Coprinopsis cinerea okayama7\|eukprot:XP_001839387.2 hypothetical protein CC1G_11087 [Coprinopsis cinerea okayama7\
MADLQRTWSGSTLCSDFNEGPSRPHTPTTSENYRLAVSYMQDAHETEIAGSYKKAFNLYSRAGNLFGTVIDDADRYSVERARSKMQYCVAKTRRAMLMPAATKTGPPPSFYLPSRRTVSLELESDSGIVPLPSIEAEPPASDRSSNASTSTRFYTTRLPKETSLTSYHVYSEISKRAGKYHFDFQVKDSSKIHTLYTLSASRAPWTQFKTCTLSRAAEYHENCSRVTIEQIDSSRWAAADAAQIGRTITATVPDGRGTKVSTVPDRVDKSWAPRRFTYGGRRFVWKPTWDLGVPNLNSTEALYEVKDEWDSPRSKTGKKMDETFDRPLVKVQGKSLSIDKAATVWIDAALDQVFREFILATILTRYLIAFHGHD